MPIDEHISGPSSATTADVPPNTPAAPTWLGNAEREIDILLDTADNGYQTTYAIEVEEDGVAGNYVFRGEVYADTDVLVLTSDLGGPVSIDIADGKYDPTEAAEALQTAMNANNTLTGTGTITFAVTNDAGKFTINAGTGHTIAYTHSGSDAAALYGFTGDIAAAQTITSQDYGLFNAVTATLDAQTVADWTTVIRVMNLSSPSSPLPYRFRTIAYGYTAPLSATSEWSEIMLPHIDLALGPLNTAETFECTTGNTKISGLSTTGTSNLISFTYTLTNKSATASRIVAQWATDSVFTSPQTATEDDTGGTTSDGLTNLAAAAAGTAHEFIWKSCTDVGMSYAGTIYFRIIPYDASPTGGDAGTAATTTVAVDNRPLAVTLADITTGDWDKDTTPVITAYMQSLVCGTAGYFLAHVYNSSGAAVFSYSSAERPTGWEYETATNTWVNMTYAGVAAAYMNGTKRVRFTLQDALTQGNTYTIRLQQAEAISSI